MREASELLKTPELPPEAWLDLLRLKEDLGMLAAGETTRLPFYPGLAAGFQELLPPRKRTQFEATSAEIVIDLDSSEYQLGQDRYLDCGLEIRLLAYLRMMEDWGVSVERLKTVFWPDEAFLYDQLDARIQRLAARLRTSLKFEVEVVNRTIQLAAADFGRVCVFSGGQGAAELPSFLRGLGESGPGDFQGGAVSDYYRISRTQRSVYLKRWVDAGWIIVRGSAPRLRYELVPRLDRQ